MVFLETLLFHQVFLVTVRIGWRFAQALLIALGAASPDGGGSAQAEGSQEPGEAQSALQEAGFQEASAPAPPAAPYRFDPGAGVPVLHVPREEVLEYRAYVDAGIFSASAGRVTQSCTVLEQPTSILLTGPAGSAGETALIRLFARGEYLGGLYEFESTLETRLLPQEWPRLSYQTTSKGSQTRRREVLLGTKDGQPTASYRGDTSKGAPAGTRIWRTAKERPVPAGTLDMLTAVLQVRTLIREDAASMTFPLIDKDRLWRLTLKRGEERRMETIPGTLFDVVEIVIEPTPYEGESFSERAEQFEGVFGIQGSIHLFVEKRTGITVRIQGVLPIGKEDGILKVGIDVVLDSYSGTPPEFAPVQLAKDGK